MAAFPQPKTPESADPRAWPWTSELEPWAIQSLRKDHEQALYQRGEPTILVLMWQLRDFRAGLVGRCQSCAADQTVADPTIFTDTYKQPARAYCPDCFGTTFEGGWKAQVLRPALWDTEEVEVQENTRGVVERLHATMQIPSGVALTNGDYAIRLDNTRWQCGQPTSTVMHLGYGYNGGPDGNTIGYAAISMQRVDADGDPAMLLPPTPEVVAQVLTSYNAHVPLDNSTFDTVRGPIT